MITKSIIFLLPLVAVTFAHPFLSCNCGLGPGQDVCLNSQCTPLVVRPVEIPKPVIPKPKVVCLPAAGLPPLIPVGSPCDCHTTLVKPALVPKPPCSACGGAIDFSNNQQMTLSQKQQILFGGITGGAGYGGAGANLGGVPGSLLSGASLLHSARPVLVDDPDRSPVNPANFVPADPVSLHVAYELGQQHCHQAEDKLSFGFRSIPKEIPLYMPKTGNLIPEENLFALNGHIVELKKKKCSNRKSLDEEAVEDLITLAEEEEDEKIAVGDAGKVRQVSLGEIGYAPAKIKAEFINLKPAPLAADDGLSLPVKNCNDGFKPGNVIIDEVPKDEHLSFPPVLPEPCPAEPSAYNPPPPVFPPGLFGNAGYMSSSSSCASSANSYQNSHVSYGQGGCGCNKMY